MSYIRHISKSIKIKRLYEKFLNVKTEFYPVKFFHVALQNTIFTQ